MATSGLFSLPSRSFQQRSSSTLPMRPPSGVSNHYRSSSPSPSTSPSINRSGVEVSPVQKSTCMCSPSTHAGAFRCRLHKKIQAEKKSQEEIGAAESSTNSSSGGTSTQILSAEKVLVNRTLKASRRNKTPRRRREAFQSRPSRFSIMSKADDL
ncbi:hypothetical protein IFM89_003955 [Coptis chinensis]|uniref:Serine-rich protein-like protein n=1 Tax=Coptis chinensis TaxID=261450 RepID=A0A835H406_9MAGN|nr:hypothetical protein IFM89_003955 [Coptis chinensis]